MHITNYSDVVSPLLPEPRKRHRKVRTGCRTCKLRRVKCDETFPACQRCLKLDLICDGYGIWGGGGVAESALTQGPRSSLPTAIRGGRMDLTRTLQHRSISPLGLKISLEEQDYLDWFIHGTATTPPRIFNSSFWDPTILQTTSNEPMVLQGLLALSAAHKRHVLDPVNRVREGLAPDALETFLLKHYGNAIRGLQSHLNGKKEISDPKRFTMATMCAILVLVSLLRGRFEEAFVHLRVGAGIARQIVQKTGQASQKPLLAQSFIRMQDQTMIFCLRSSDPYFQANRPSIPYTFELRFSSPSEAGFYLDDLVEQVAYLTQQAKQMPRSATTAIAMHRNVYDYLLSCFESWSIACNATVTECGLNLTPTDAAAYQALLQRYKMSRGIAEKCFRANFPIEAGESR
ncbi:hypothetical protein OPT61_g4654 [Boeremia exigua]|uniref:Uncharacterized protein n=1 Tax=Boeremia exigua TaxID=749465 RepID=A0ACC2IDG2_9PLEO|nr:hypothetical protein OPT61_g4654 [Boeremia exigua]